MPRIGFRPSKERSILALIGSIVMVGVGVFIVIPTFGAFGVFWTVMVFMFGVYHAYLAFSGRGIDTEIYMDEFNPNQNNNFNQISQNFLGNADVETRLKKLASLKNQNLISVEEYKRKREEILREL